MKNYYAIEIHGIKNDIFCIKKVDGNWIVPVDYVAYRSLNDALASAENQELKIEKVGSFYEII